MADDVTARGCDVSVDRVRRNLAEVRDELAAAAAGRTVRVLAAVKYLATDDVGVLVRAGIEVAGENRAQALADKAAAHRDLEWHFIGHLQSRKVRQVLAHATLIHSVCSDSVLEQLRRHAPPQTKVLIEVNVAAEAGKSGVAAADVGAFLERAASSGVDVVGLMTMPPQARTAEDSRRWFAALRELATVHGLRELSMGTSQDYAVAASEGSTIVRIGSRLLR